MRILYPFPRFCIEDNWPTSRLDHLPQIHGIHRHLPYASRDDLALSPLINTLATALRAPVGESFESRGKLKEILCETTLKAQWIIRVALRES